MSTFESAIRRIEQYRICLERDSDLGIIASEARDPVDECYRSLEAVLRSARIELEGAGEHDAGETRFGSHVVGSCSMLAMRLFRGMYRETDAVRLGRLAHAVRSDGRALMEHLWARLAA